MKPRALIHNLAVAALCLFVCGLGPAHAVDQAKVNALLDRLATADDQDALRLEREVVAEWSKSGSPAMDVLLMRGRAAMAAGDTTAAIAHLTALTDHAPDFAEGWNALAMAYFQAGELGPSVEDIAHTLTLNPRHFGALAGLGMIFEELNQPAKALEVYRAALTIHPHLVGVIEAVKRLEAAQAGQDL